MTRWPSIDRRWHAKANRDWIGWPFDDPQTTPDAADLPPDELEPTPQLRCQACLGHGTQTFGRWAVPVLCQCCRGTGQALDHERALDELGEQANPRWEDRCADDI